MFSKKELAIVGILDLLAKTISCSAELSTKTFNNLRVNLFVVFFQVILLDHKRHKHRQRADHLRNEQWMKNFFLNSKHLLVNWLKRLMEMLQYKDRLLYHVLNKITTGETTIIFPLINIPQY